MKTKIKKYQTGTEVQSGPALKPTGAKIAVGSTIATALGMGAKILSDRMKAKKEEKKAKKEAEENNEKTTETKKGRTMKSKLTKASKGVIVKMNGNQLVQKVAGSSGVKSGVNPKAKNQKSPKGRVGGNNKSVTVVPKAKYGMSMRKK